MVETTQETIRIAKETGVPSNVTHIKIGGQNAWGLMKDVVKLINDARSEGINITADMYAYREAGGGSLATVFNISQDMDPLAKLGKKGSFQIWSNSEKRKNQEINCRRMS